MKYPERTAFIISNPKHIVEILEKKPAFFHILLVGENRSRHANVTECRGKRFRSKGRLFRLIGHSSIRHPVEKNGSMQIS
jgi:hypothetical protein